MHRTTDERDPLVTLLAQVNHGELAAFDVVDTDAAPRGIRAAVDEDHRHAAAGMDRELRRLLRDGRDQDAAHALLEQQVEIIGLARRVAIAVTDVQRHAGGPSDLLDAFRHVREEGVRRVEYDVRDGSTVPGPQLPAGFVANESEFLDRPQDLAARRFADPVGAVQDVGHGAHRHAGTRSDVLDPG